MPLFPWCHRVLYRLAGHQLCGDGLIQCPGCWCSVWLGCCWHFEVQVCVTIRGGATAQAHQYLAGAGTAATAGQEDKTKAAPWRDTTPKAAQPQLIPSAPATCDKIDTIGSLNLGSCRLSSQNSWNCDMQWYPSLTEVDYYTMGLHSLGANSTSTWYAVIYRRTGNAGLAQEFLWWCTAWLSGVLLVSRLLVQNSGIRERGN